MPRYITHIETDRGAVSRAPEPRAGPDLTAMLAAALSLSDPTPPAPGLPDMRIIARSDDGAGLAASLCMSDSMMPVLSICTARRSRATPALWDHAWGESPQSPWLATSESIPGLIGDQYDACMIWTRALAWTWLRWRGPTWPGSHAQISR